MNIQREQAKEVLLLVPNFIKLLYRLLSDNRVLSKEKALVLGTVVYVLSPLDFLPDVIPFVGQIDDLLLVALILKRFLNSVSPSVLMQYWDGPDELLYTIDKILDIARVFLPAGVYNRIVKRARQEPDDGDYQV